ncbi:Phospholipase A and acyltransferase 1 [Bulinus truncatus]|nr:Phospholipase A and acyltransferase 1 [Bulinus truncatus]
MDELILRKARTFTTASRIQFKRKFWIIHFYSHWAIYMGFHNDIASIVHYKSKEPFDGRPKSVVSKENILTAGNLETMTENNDLDKVFPRFPVSEILRKAESYVGQAGYNLISNNCEHFVNIVRYGKHYSEQIILFVQVWNIVITLIIYCLSLYENMIYDIFLYIDLILIGILQFWICEKVTFIVPLLRVATQLRLIIYSTHWILAVLLVPLVLFTGYYH